MEWINSLLSGTLVPVCLCACAIYFLVALRALPLRRASQILRGGGRGSLRAVSVALAGTLGVGNIVGVASAIALGGAGAVLWMWISALLAMILKYSEVVLALVHRRARGSETYGGAAYYMADCFAQRGHPRLGRAYGAVFATLCLVNAFTMGGVIQSDSIARSAESILGIDGAWVGIGLTLLCVCVFFLGGGGIFKLCETLVPLASIGYCIICLAVIFLHIDKVPSLLCRIVREGMSFDAAAGGVFGFLGSRALRFGTIRGLFSNEAGCGSSTIAHATSATADPRSQGVLGMVEVFVDTIVVCTMTALVVLLVGEDVLISGISPMSAVAVSFERTLGEVGGVMLCIFVLLFAFATIICWGYYGRECVIRLGGGARGQRAYYIMLCAFVLVGACTRLDTAWQIADLTVGAMTLMNLPVLLLMRHDIIRSTFSP